jgi:RNA polymerase sigma-70 factor, ECF subfamily
MPEESNPGPDDVELLRQAAAGNARAFHELVDRHADRLYRLATSLVGNAADAEDVLQETFTGAFRGLKGFEQRASVRTWLTRILVTQAAKWRRDRKRRMVEPIEPHEESMGRTGAQESAAAKIDLQAALQKLSDEHRQVLVLREFDLMSYDEIAQVLDVPRGTVESRLHRARLELREKMKAYVS